MQSKIFFTVKYAVAFILVIFSSAFIPKYGGDSFEIRLGNKVLVKEYVVQHVALKTVTLSKENLNDRLTVYYNHCGQTGINRIISLQNASGKLIKQWRFTDGNNTGMDLPVKDVLLTMEKNGNNLGLYYASQQLPNGRLLTNLYTDVNATAAK